MEDLLDRLGRLAAELQDRHVFRVMAGYCPSAWLLIQLADSIAPNLGWVPDDLTTVIIYSSALGMPVALFLAWRFNLTAEGLQRSVAGTERSTASSSRTAHGPAGSDRAGDDGELEDARRAAGPPGPEAGAPGRERWEEPPSGSRFRIPPFAYLGSLVLLVAASLVGFVEIRIRLPWAEESDLTLVAVLPYENSGDGDGEYLTEGLTDQILSSLHVPGLGVIARNSVRRYRSAGLSLDRMDEHLGAEYVLEGSVRWRPSTDGPRRARVTSQLVRVRDGSGIWSETREAPRDSLFLAGAAIATEAARVLGATAGADGTPTGDLRASPSRLEAEEYYRLAEEFLVGDPRPDRVALQAAVRSYEEAVRVDPLFHRALVELARTHLEMYRRDLDRSPSRLAAARRAAEKASSVAPDAAESHRALGRYFHLGAGDYETASDHYEVALELTPHAPMLLGLMADVRRRRGDFQEAVSMYARALKFDPWAAELHYEQAETLRRLRRFARAAPAYREAIRLAPTWEVPYAGLAWSRLADGGSVANAREPLLDGKRKTPDDLLIDLHLSELYLMEERPAGSLALLESRTSRLVWTEGRVFVLDACRGEALRLAGRETESGEAYQSARQTLTDLVARHPEDPRLRSALGLVYAALGERAAALREGRLALQLRPVSEDALWGPERVMDLARIHLLLGERKRAREQLKRVLSRPSTASRQLIRSDPRWSALRSGVASSSRPSRPAETLEGSLALRAPGPVPP